MTKQFFVYILSNKNNNVLYIGVTSNLIRRIFEHKNALLDGFTKKYNVHKLVYYEFFGSPQEAIKREKKLKNWHRQWKNNIINRSNPNWDDLYDELIH